MRKYLVVILLLSLFGTLPYKISAAQPENSFGCIWIGIGTVGTCRVGWNTCEDNYYSESRICNNKSKSECENTPPTIPCFIDVVKMTGVQSEGGCITNLQCQLWPQTLGCNPDPKNGGYACDAALTTRSFEGKCITNLQCQTIHAMDGCRPAAEGKGYECEAAFTTRSIQKFSSNSSDTTGTSEALCGTDNKGVNTAIGCLMAGDPKIFISQLLGWGVGIGGGIAFLMIVLAGFQMVTASGDPKKVQAAKELLTSAIAGLVLIVLSVVLLNFIGVSILGLNSLGFSIP